MSIAKDKVPSIRLKYIKHFFYIYHYLHYICWVDVIYLTCLVFLKSPWWLVWIFCIPTHLTLKLNFKIKLRKENTRKYFVTNQKFLKNISWPINICLRYFMTPTKTLWPSTYILNVRSLNLIDGPSSFISKN